jgi:hypothetical protein
MLGIDLTTPLKISSDLYKITNSSEISILEIELNEEVVLTFPT